uniref:Cadherin-89D n=1 Tax=Panagrellus redivivus TaxID=6233 RepID=A0A7E4VI44_PANRE
MAALRYLAFGLALLFVEANPKSRVGSDIATKPIGFRSGCALTEKTADISSTLAELPLRGHTFGPDADIQLKLLRGSEHVSLDARNKKLILEEALDRDNGLTRFEVVIECKSLLDDTLPQLNISTFVTIKDVNDNAPEFDKAEYAINLPEELPEGTPVALDFEAVDIDQEGPNSFVKYRIIAPEGADELLTIPDPYKPQIVVAGRIDFEKLRHFEVEIEAEDGGSPSQKSKAKLNVIVTDVDDLNPVFQHENYHTNSIQDQIFEVFPDPIFAKDADTLNDPVYYELTGEFAEFYSINGTGTVRLVKDTVISTTLFVHARQVNRPERAATAILRVTNQSSIEFQHLLYSIQLTSNSPKGMEVAQAKAISSTPNTKLRYNILEDEAHIAYIEELTGRIFLNATPTKEKYAMRLLATDGKSRAWSRLELTVKKVNVYEPEFDQPEYYFDVNGPDLIGQVRAVDRDENDTISYRLLNLHDLFTIDSDGMLAHKISNKLTPGMAYELVVMAEDSQKHKSFVNVVLKTPSAQQSMNFFLICALFIIGGAILVLFGMLFARKVISCWPTVWPTARHHDNSWRGKQLSDSGVVITRSAGSETDSYPHRISHRRFGSSTSIEDKDRDTAAISYSNTSFPPPPAALLPSLPTAITSTALMTSQSATCVVSQAGSAQHNVEAATANSSPARMRNPNAPAIYF